jgi:hypothetical protein
MTASTPSPASALAAFLGDQPAPNGEPAALGRLMRGIIDHGLDNLPLPGSGHTLARWQALAEVAAHDLSLFKLFEGHTDALAILAELSAPTAPGLWAVWCAEPPDGRVTLQSFDNAIAHIHGTKRWCSGAALVDHAIVSAWDENNRQCLVRVNMRQRGVAVTQLGWNAVGMSASASVDVLFDDAEALRVGSPGDYLERAGFWHGAAGIAAGWLGGAGGVALALHHASRHDAHAQAHLGAVDAALGAALALLRETATTIDAAPYEDLRCAALRTRLAAEAACETVLSHVTRALGAGPLCHDAHLARAVADLPVFLRQSHAERDQATLAQWLHNLPEPAWRP